MTRAAKRKSQRTDHAMTTEQLAKKVLKDLKRMSPDEKSELRALMDKEFKRAPRLKNVDSYADAVRRCAAEEAMSNYDGNGKPVN
jgi:hypothetical protein